MQRVRTSAVVSVPMSPGGVRTVTSGARRPSSVVYFNTVRAATAAQTMAMMATLSATRPAELCTGVCSPQSGVVTLLTVLTRNRNDSACGRMGLRTTGVGQPFSS